MRKLLVLVGLAACLTGSAFAQEADNPTASGIITIPEDERGGLIGLEANSHMEVTLDDQMRIATLQGGTMPAEPDFDTAELSRTEETLVAAGMVNHWAASGSIGFSLMLMDDQANLKVSNNTDEPIAYIIALYRGDPVDQNYQLTTTCTVPARKVSVESWPYLVDGVMIVSVMTPPPSDRLLCVDPTESVKTPKWYPLEMQ